jgi:hypothetical protein
MSDVIGLVIIAFLLLIAIELLLIHRDLMRSQSRAKPHGDEPAGQTINVNVGTQAGLSAVPVATAVTGIPGQDLLEGGKTGESDQASALLDEAGDGQAEPIPPPSPAERPAYNISARPTPSGLVAKKCSACGAENSSYRNQCFNCGAPV